MRRGAFTKVGTFVVLLVALVVAGIAEANMDGGCDSPAQTIGFHRVSRV
jgi:hypothetical protein